nr:MAG TPA: peptidase [Caudoviricetes sp.]
MEEKSYNLPFANKKVYDLIQEKTNGNVKAFAESINVSQQSLNRIFCIDKRNGKYPSVSNEIKQGIIDVYGKDEIWFITDKNELLTGEGEMLVGDQPHIINNKAIKYYPNVDGSMGGLQFLENPDETTFDISIPGYSDCKYAINAYGDSMYPLIQSGQIVLLVPWQESFIDWGRIYLVVTKSGYRAIKRIFPASDNDHILCKSENGEKFPPFEIEKNDIANIFLVKGWICRNEI